MVKDIPDFLEFMESHIIKYNTVSLSGIILLDIMVRDMDKIDEGDAVVGALNHLVHIKALRSNEGIHKIGLCTDIFALSNNMVIALGYIPALVSEVGAKGGLVNKEEGAISKLLQGLEVLVLFTLEINIFCAILIVWGNSELFSQKK